MGGLFAGGMPQLKPRGSSSAGSRGSPSTSSRGSPSMSRGSSRGGPPPSAGRGATPPSSAGRGYGAAPPRGGGGSAPPPRGGGGAPPPSVGRGAFGAPRGGGGPPPAAPKPVAAPKPSEPQCKALFDFDAQQSGDLGFKTGDVITVVKKDGEWWTGKKNGKEGIFPSNYVELL
mmetsp:Transcript_13232/g.18042  ORF Transcript_13232/g.18042 Transcript_13232/m.18042 type:complete len:173 (+) Transcript_13232:2-520(+)